MSASKTEIAVEVSPVVSTKAEAKTSRKVLKEVNEDVKVPRKVTKPTEVVKSPAKTTIPKETKKTGSSSIVYTTTDKTKMIKDAIGALNERKGSSKIAIKKYIIAHYSVDETKTGFIKNFIKKALIDGTILQAKGKNVNGSFRLPKSIEVTKKSKPKTVKSPKKTKKTVKPLKKSPKKKIIAVKSPKKNPVVIVASAKKPLKDGPEPKRSKRNA